MSTTLDFLTLEEEELFPIKTQESGVDFITLEEEQLPPVILEDFSQFIICEASTNKIPFELIINEKEEIKNSLELIINEDLPNRLSRNFICNDSISLFNQSNQPNIYISGGSLFVPKQPNLPNNQL